MGDTVDRKAQQADFIYQMGLLLKPLLDIIEDPAKFDDAERRHVRARYQVDYNRLVSDIKAFCGGDPGAVYSVERHDIERPLAQIYNLVQQKLVSDPSGMATELEGYRQEFLKAIAAFR